MAEHFVSMCPPTGFFLTGVRIYTRSVVGWIEWPRVTVEKRRNVWDLAVVRLTRLCTVHPAVAFSLVLLTKVFCQKPSCPHCTPGPGMIDTLSHYLMTALVERQCWGEILGNTWGLAHKHRQTHTHSHTHIQSTQTHPKELKHTLAGYWMYISSHGVQMCVRALEAGFTKWWRFKEGHRCFADHVHCAAETCYFRQQSPLWDEDHFL